MASLVAGTLCRQARSVGRPHTVNQNHFASQSRLIQLCLRNFASKKMGLPRVFFDMAVDGEAAGRFVVEVSGKTPKNGAQFPSIIVRNFFFVRPLNRLLHLPNWRKKSSSFLLLL